MALFRVVPGSFSVIPSKASFASGEQVDLKVKCTVERKNGLGAWATWTSTYKVYKKDGSLLATSTRQHNIAPWTDIDSAADDFTVPVGAFSPGLLEGYVTVAGSG